MQDILDSDEYRAPGKINIESILLISCWIILGINYTLNFGGVFGYYILLDLAHILGPLFLLFTTIVHIRSPRLGLKVLASFLVFNSIGLIEIQYWYDIYLGLQVDLGDFFYFQIGLHLAPSVMMFILYNKRKVQLAKFWDQLIGKTPEHFVKKQTSETNRLEKKYERLENDKLESLLASDHLTEEAKKAIQNILERRS